MGLTDRMRTIIVCIMSAKGDRPTHEGTPATAWPQDDTAPPDRRTTSRELLGARGQLVIEHMGREYRLRFTRNGKLILTA